MLEVSAVGITHEPPLTEAGEDVPGNGTLICLYNFFEEQSSEKLHKRRLLYRLNQLSQPAIGCAAYTPVNKPASTILSEHACSPSAAHCVPGTYSSSKM